MNKSEKKKRKWFEWGMVASIIGLFSLLFTYINNWGGSMDVTYQMHLMNIGETKTIVVCLEDTSINLNYLSVTPTFKCTSRVSLKHFSLSFEAECMNVTLVPSVFVDAYNYNESKYLFKYKEKELSANDDSKPPFSSIKMYGSKGRCKIKSKASFDGESSPFEYYTDVLFFVVPNNDSLPYTDWKKECEERVKDSIKEGYCDKYYFAKNHQPEYEYLCDTVLPPIPIFENYDMLTEEEDGVEVKDSIIAQCKVTRTDRTLNYYLTPNPGIIEPGLYLLEGRIKPKKTQEQFSYKHDFSVICIDNKQVSNKITKRFRKGKVPRIDRISLYRQCVNEDVISIEKKSFFYVIRNKSESAIVFQVHHSANSSKIYTLNGGGKKRLRKIGESPIEVFVTHRKTVNERFGFRDYLPLLLYGFLAFISLIGCVLLVLNINPIFENLPNDLSDLKHAFEKTLLSVFDWKKASGAIVGILFIIYMLSSPIGLYFCYRFYFL